jgi:hypothetical protein
VDGARQRLEQEPRAIAALNHPHICMLYDVGVPRLVIWIWKRTLLVS